MLINTKRNILFALPQSQNKCKFQIVIRVKFDACVYLMSEPIYLNQIVLFSFYTYSIISFIRNGCVNGKCFILEF